MSEKAGRAWTSSVGTSGRGSRVGCLESGIHRYYLQRWPSQRAMKRIRAKVKALIGRRRGGMDIRGLIAELNPILRGWGNYFRTGNAAEEFNKIDRYVAWRLRRPAGQAQRPQPARRARPTLDARLVQGPRPPPAAGHHPLPAQPRSHARKIIGKPCAGKPHARIERGNGETGLRALRP